MKNLLKTLAVLTFVGGGLLFSSCENEPADGPDGGGGGGSFTPATSIESFIDFSKNYAYPASWKNPGVLNDLSEFTIEAYVRLNPGARGAGWQVHTPIVCARNAAAMGLVQVAPTIGSPWQATAGSHGTYANSTETYKGGDDGMDLHMVMVGSNGTFTLYVNGAPVILDQQMGGWGPYNFANASGDYANGDCLFLGFMATASHDLSVLGTYTTIAGQGMGLENAAASFQLIKGGLAEVRIWDHKLTVDEITAEGHPYAVSPKSEGLVAYWKCDETEGKTLKDATGNGNDLTLYNEIVLLDAPEE